MKVLVKEPNRDPEIKEIEYTLEAMQAIVGGLIQILPLNGLSAYGISLYCNEDGKRNGDPINMPLPAWVGTAPGDFLVGTVFFCGSNGDDDVSLTDDEEQIARTWITRVQGA